MSCTLIIYYIDKSHIVSCQTHYSDKKLNNTPSNIVFDHTTDLNLCKSICIKDPTLCTTIDRYIKGYNLLHQRYVYSTKKYGDGTSLQFKNKYTNDVAVYDEYNDTHIKNLIKDKILNIISSHSK